MLTKQFYLIIILALSAYWATSKVAHCSTDSPGVLTVSMLIFSAEQRNALEEIAIRFNDEHPAIRVKFVAADDTNYKQNSAYWLQNPNDIDVLHWPWPSQLKEFAKKGWIEPVTNLWLTEEIRQNYSPLLKELITVEGKQYGLPYTSGFWGFYYRRSLFESLNLDPPESWQDFLALCATLKKNNITPITIGLKTPWPAAAWFDYVNLRMNGLEFHRSVLRGEVSFHSPDLLQVFDALKELVDNQYFIQNAGDFDFKEVIPLLYRNNAAMVLSGNFISTQFAKAIRDDLRFFPFPVMNKEILRYEEVPTDSFVIPSASNNIERAKLFLAFVAKPKPQQLINSVTNFIPPNRLAKVDEDYFSAEGKKLILASHGYSQYLDRDAKKEFAEPVKDILSLFIQNGDKEKAINALEALRLQVFAVDNTDEL